VLGTVLLDMADGKDILKRLAAAGRAFWRALERLNPYVVVCVSWKLI